MSSLWKSAVLVVLAVLAGFARQVEAQQARGLRGRRGWTERPWAACALRAFCGL